MQRFLWISSLSPASDWHYSSAPPWASGILSGGLGAGRRGREGERGNPSTFSKNRDRLLDGDIAAGFLIALLVLRTRPAGTALRRSDTERRV